MKKKRSRLVSGLILFAAIVLCGCGGDQEYVQISANDTKAKEFLPLAEADAETAPTAPEDPPQLTALVDNLEEAQEIADLYGIELDSYSYGVAAYRTDQDIGELLLFGEEHNYPTLAPNQTSESLIEPAQ